MKAKKIINSLLILVCCLSIISCTSEQSIIPPDNTKPIEEEQQIPMELPVTRGINGNLADSVDFRVGTVRLMVIKNGYLRNNKLLSGLTKDSTEVIIRDSVPTGKVDYFLIANELSSWNLGALTVDNTLSSSTLKSKVLSFGAGDNYPQVSDTEWIPMLAHFENLEINTDSKAYHTGVEVTDSLGKLTRMYAKVTLDLKSAFAKLDNGGEPIELDSVFVSHMPKESYLYRTVYTKGNFFNGINGKGLTGNTYREKSDSIIGHFTFYIPEHIVGDPADRTYLSAVVRLVADPTIKREYKIAIGDSIANWNRTNDHNEYLMTRSSPEAVRVSRNKHYIFNAEIQSFDKTSGYDLKIESTVIAWESGKLDYTDIWQYDLKVSPQDNYYIGTVSPYEGVVTIETNAPKGWSVSGSNGVTFENSSGVYVPTLENQTGNKLRFRYSNSGLSGTIDIKAGSVVKQIKLIR